MTNHPFDEIFAIDMEHLAYYGMGWKYNRDILD